MAEEVASSWDNWDVDADVECKFRDSVTLLKREIVSEGVVEYRIKSQYQLTKKSFLLQDMVFYAESPLILFETRMDWQKEQRQGLF